LTCTGRNFQFKNPHFDTFIAFQSVVRQAYWIASKLALMRAAIQVLFDPSEGRYKQGGTDLPKQGG
jgi:hypothetical protein